MRWIVPFAAVLALVAWGVAHPREATLTLVTKPSPLGIGQNLFEVTVTDSDGRPVSDGEVKLQLLMPADPKTKHPEMRTEGQLNNIGSGRYNGIAMVMMAGDWDVTVTATRKGESIGTRTERLTAHLTRPE
jgi:hypothetical protein